MTLSLCVRCKHTVGHLGYFHLETPSRFQLCNVTINKLVYAAHAEPQLNDKPETLFLNNMAGFIMHYLIIDGLHDDTVYRKLISYVCNEIRLLVSDPIEGEKEKYRKWSDMLRMLSQDILKRSFMPIFD